MTAPKAPPADAWQLLSPRFTEARRKKLETVAAKRTAKVRLVLQDVHDPHNVAACLRTAEALGVQHIDIITLSPPKRRSGAARGTSSWLTLHIWSSIEDCLANLKHHGFQIAAGFPPHRADVTLGEILVEKPLALVFGNEHFGLADTWMGKIDTAFTIPTVGMVESLNISVAAAMTLLVATTKARSFWGEKAYYISDSERSQCLNTWAYASVSHPELELARLRKDLVTNAT